MSNTQNEFKAVSNADLQKNQQIAISIYMEVEKIQEVETFLNAAYCERHGASSQQTFFPQSYGTFKQRDILETIDFFDIVNGMNQPGRAPVNSGNTATYILLHIRACQVG